MKDRQYWLERGKNGDIYEGFVCIGVSDKGFLTETLKINPLELYCFDLTLEKITNDWMGGSSSHPYYLTEQKFNELFPEKPIKYQVTEVDLTKKSEQEKMKLVACLGFSPNESGQYYFYNSNFNTVICYAKKSKLLKQNAVGGLDLIMIERENNEQMIYLGHWNEGRV